MRNKIWLAGGEVEQINQEPTQIIRLEAPQDDSGALAHIKGSDNTISFYGDIDMITAGELNRLLTEVDLRLQNTKNILGDSYTPTINLRIRSDGGTLFEGIAVLDRIRTLKSKLHTYVEGGAASAATLISVAGHKRFIGKNSLMLIHQLSGGSYGNFQQMEDQHENHRRLMGIIKSVYKQYTKIPMKVLDEILKRDLWLTAEQCLEYGMVDEII
jgi:ATP-dependent Clp endopeptidase proteolytic subunit ClpP